MSIFVIYHKQFPLIEAEGFIPIQGGAEIAKEKLPIIGDNTGQNISRKNTSFCELTVQYWAWKNFDSDYYGFFHYRRFLNLSRQRLFEPKFVDFSLNTLKKYGWQKDNIDLIMSKYDIVLPKKTLFLGPFFKKQTLKEHYSIYHNERDLDLIREIISKRHPRFLSSFDKTMLITSAYCYNIFIMRRKLFYDYMEWLFDILFEAEKKIYVDLTNDYQKRVFGFLGERLLNVFVEYVVNENKSIKLKEFQLCSFK